MELHEKTQSHITASLALVQRSRLIDCVDVIPEVQIENQAKYWKSVLERTVHVIKFLAERGIQFWGHDEKFGSLANGNYILEAIAKYNPFLASHIDKHCNPGRGKKSYLSSTICKDLISLTGKIVLPVILEQLKASKFYQIFLMLTD